MRILMILAASALSAMLVLPTVSQGQSIGGGQQTAAAVERSAATLGQA